MAAERSTRISVAASFGRTLGCERSRSAAVSRFGQIGGSRRHCRGSRKPRAAMPSVIVRVETMHAICPLPADDRALDRLQQPERQNQRQRQPEQEMHPIGRREGNLDREHERHHDVTDNENDEIGRSVVGALMMERLSAGRAMIGHLQECAKQPAAAAMRADAAQSASTKRRSRRVLNDPDASAVSFNRAVCAAIVFVGGVGRGRAVAVRTFFAGRFSCRPLGQDFESQRARDRDRLHQPHRDNVAEPVGFAGTSVRSWRGGPRDTGNNRRRWCGPE